MRILFLRANRHPETLFQILSGKLNIHEPVGRRTTSAGACASCTVRLSTCACTCDVTRWTCDACFLAHITQVFVSKLAEIRKAT